MTWHPNWRLRFTADDGVHFAQNVIRAVHIWDFLREQIPESLLNSMTSGILRLSFFATHRSIVLSVGGKLAVQFKNLLCRAGLDEDRDWLNIGIALKSSDSISTDVQNTVSSLVGDISDALNASSVEIVLELSRFNEEIILDIFLHIVLVDKVVVTSVNLSLAWWSGSVWKGYYEYIAHTI